MGEISQSEADADGDRPAGIVLEEWKSGDVKNAVIYSSMHKCYSQHALICIAI